MSLVTLPGRITGIACRFRDSNNMYTFVVTNHGGYSIWKLVDGRWTILTPPEVRSSNAFTPTATYRRAYCVGNTLTLYVNGQKLAETTDTEFSSGYVGLYAEDGVTRSGKDGPAPVEVWFDNFKASTPSERAPRIYRRFLAKNGVSQEHGCDRGAMSERQRTSSRSSAQEMSRQHIERSGTGLGPTPVNAGA